MFEGSFDHAIDRKGRVAVPARFREVLASEYKDETLYITRLEKCLVLFPLQEWEVKLQIARRIPITDTEAQDWLRFFVSGAVRCPIDRQGRILIPPTLREHAALDRQVIFAAMLTNFEIWDKPRYQEGIKRTGSNFSAIASRMEKYGL